MYVTEGECTSLVILFYDILEDIGNGDCNWELYPLRAWDEFLRYEAEEIVSSFYIISWSKRYAPDQAVMNFVGEVGIVLDLGIPPQ